MIKDQPRMADMARDLLPANLYLDLQKLPAVRLPEFAGGIPSGA